MNMRHRIRSMHYWRRYLAGNRWVAMNMRHRIRRMPLLYDLDWQKVQFAMPYTASGDNEIGKTFHAFDGTLQDDHFKAVFMIHMHMHGG